MKKNYGLLLKKEKVVINGQKQYVLCFVSSMEYERPNDDKFLLINIDNSIEKSCNIKYINEYEADYYYLTTKAIKNTKTLEKINNEYMGSFYRIINGKLKRITNKENIEEIAIYINNQTIKKTYEKIKSKVIGQDEHIKSILTSVLLNLNLYDSKYPLTDITNNKHNILVIGKKGTGKTEIIKQVADLLNIPITIESTPAYYLLDNNSALIDSMIINLIYKAEGDTSLAEKGIIVIDNFDTLFKLKENYSYVTCEYIQKELIKLMDGDTRVYNISDENVKLNTHAITVILLADFTNINNNTIEGFNIKKDNDINKLNQIGIKPELLDRISKIRVLNDLSKEDLINIAKSKRGKLMYYVELLKAKGINITISEEFIDKIVEEAIKDNRGVRSLNKIIDKYLDNEFNDILNNKPKKKIK